jgi:hypothetical protein
MLGLNKLYFKDTKIFLYLKDISFLFLSNRIRWVAHR